MAHRAPEKSYSCSINKLSVKRADDDAPEYTSGSMTLHCFLFGVRNCHGGCRFQDPDDMPTESGPPADAGRLRRHSVLVPHAYQIDHNGPQTGQCPVTNRGRCRALMG